MKPTISADAYPLAWPEGWPRTPSADVVEGKYRFRRSTYDGGKFWTFSAARDALVEEVGRLNGGGPLVISSNFRTARDGLPVEGSRRPPDQAVAIYFDLAGEQKVMACDRFLRAEENMRSLTLAIEAMRALERHGGGLMMEKAFAGFVALPPPRSCWDILGVKPGASDDEIDRAWREMVRTVHPDHGGSVQSAAEINAARDEAKRRNAV